MFLNTTIILTTIGTMFLNTTTTGAMLRNTTLETSVSAIMAAPTPVKISVSAIMATPTPVEILISPVPTTLETLFRVSAYQANQSAMPNATTRLESDDDDDEIKKIFLFGTCGKSGRFDGGLCFMVIMFWLFGAALVFMLSLILWWFIKCEIKYRRNRR